ncbi:hypothetical protein PICMEDRAFT_14414 [Pichia membranifaciens NRRL Y-2026]|uniref:Cap-associated protein CAF20 n=1 Tax=Pichia membranifaciens NRRL Y-2026 TaxID=763406 RepID=A0A1E3NS36_9ASCO|nr:hypothetical protein PICMEDRAFT_14414 [Pichia membranifaciens NRRL Y-2026]ODQ48891.1 hypothetical protein PICMEDRAFT_14414 [Pichia membranifaciens NRRL Y-2026]
MVLRYTEEELRLYEAGACLPDGVDLTPFLTLVADVTEALKQLEEQHPRRKSFNHHRPQRKKQPKEIVDEDGWTSFVPKKAHEEEESSAIGSSAADAIAEVEGGNDDFEEVSKPKQHTIKIKTNASKISSGKSSVADTRDAIAITQVSKFNAFDALADDDDE